MAIVSNAIILSFHLKTKPNELERKIARPLGIIFWALSLCCLGVGVGNYISASFAPLPFLLLCRFSLRTLSSPPLFRLGPAEVTTLVFYGRLRDGY